MIPSALPDPPPPRGDGLATSPGDVGPRHESCELAVAIVSAVLDVPVAAITAPNRASAASAHARHVAMYLAHVTLQLRPGQVAAGFGRDRTSVAYAVRRIEDRRDEPAFDALMDRLERLATACRHFASRGGTAEPGARP